MLHLQALGGPDLSVSGAEVRPILRQPKRLALLVYLAAAGPHGYRRRDTILALLWPDRDHERARGALRQALYVLRRELGEAVIRGRGDEELGIDPAHLTFDASAMEQAFDSGNSHAALGLYRGDFLDGFFVSGAAGEFDRWVAAERARLRALASQAAWAVAADDVARTPAAAAASIRRAVALAPDDEAAVRRALILLQDLGDRAAALQLYQEFRERLAREYGAHPAPETLALGESLREPGAIANGGPDHHPAGLRPRPNDPIPAASPPVPATPARHARGLPLLLTAAALVMVSALVFWPGSRPPVVALDPNRLIALPLRIVGQDSGLGFLREGMIDLLAPRLAGASGPQLADAAVVLQSWRRAGGRPDHDLSQPEALDLARQLRAGWLLLTTLVGSPSRIDLQASLYRVADGRMERPVLVSGPPDSLHALVDRFAAALSLRAAGEEEARLADLMTRSLPALKDYLAAQQSFRAGAYRAATAEFKEALQLDSSFALAGLELAASSSYWGDGGSGAGPGLAAAWRWQSRLPPRDREFLHFVAEPGYPAASTLHDKIDNWEEATIRFPDRAVTWFQLGDNLFHWGLQIGIDDAEQRAASAFDRAIALDSSFAPALEHRIWLAADEGDTALLHRLGSRYLATDPDAERLEAHRWRIAAATGDSATLQELRSRFTALPTEALGAIHRISQEGFPSPRDAEAAIALIRLRASRADEQFEALMKEHDLALNSGQPRRAAQLAARSKLVEDPNWTDSEGRILVYDALYWGGDTAVGAAAARALAARAALPLPVEPRARARRYFDLCAAAQWRLARGDKAYARDAATRLDGTHPPQDQPGDVAEHTVCGAMLGLGLALADSVDLEAPAARLDSLLTYGPWVYALVRQTAVFTLAKSWERRGNALRALATIRRRELGLWNRLLTTRLREEGRLAAAAGDTAAAIAAYRHYLALRPEPEEGLIAEVSLVRGELPRLEEGARGPGGVSGRSETLGR